MKVRRMNKRILILLFSFMVGMTTGSAEENKNTLDGKSDEITNIGFEKNPPATWVNKFPMCEKFLKVEWIDKEKKIGFSKYDVYQNGKKNGQMTVLIYLNKYFPGYDYDVCKYSKNKKLEELFEFIKKGDIVGRDEQLQIKNKNKVVTFWSAIPLNPVKATIADNTISLCVVYPKEDLAWVVEGKKVSKAYSKNEINVKLKELNKYIPGLVASAFEEFIVLDVNHDGKDDYVYRGMIYSMKDQYFVRKRIKSFYQGGEKYVVYLFPHNNKKCVIKEFSNYIVTDGKDYILSNKCDLTEFSKR